MPIPRQLYCTVYEYVPSSAGEKPRKAISSPHSFAAAADGGHCDHRQAQPGLATHLEKIRMHGSFLGLAVELVLGSHSASPLITRGGAGVPSPHLLSRFRSWRHPDRHRTPPAGGGGVVVMRCDARELGS